MECVTIGDVSIAVVEGEAVRAPLVADWALTRGISALTTGELARVLDVPPDQVRRRLAVPTRRGEWVQPARGLWVPVRPEHRLAGGPPGAELVGDLASYLGFGYYVGWLTAAALHGAAHHAPQVFQVATSRIVEDRVVGLVRFEFRRRGRVGVVATRELRVYNGDVPYSTPAVTALDLATDLGAAGGLGNAATVVADLVGEAGLTGDQVADAARWFPVASARRVGWVMEHVAGAGGLGRLRVAARVGSVPPSLLHPGRPRRGGGDTGWGLVLNAEVEAEL
jgi:predicted transcriptional regulator of viral defense system